MKKYIFSKPIVVSPSAPQHINVLWADVNQNTGELKAFKEYVNGEWVVTFTASVPEYSDSFKEALKDSLSVEDLTSLVVDLAEELGFEFVDDSEEEEDTTSDNTDDNTDDNTEPGTTE